MKCLTFIILLLLACTANAQQKYYKKVVAFSDVHDFQKVILVDDDYVAIGNYKYSDSLYFNSYINKFNKYGDDVFLQRYEFDDMSIGSKTLTKTDNGYAFSGWVYTGLPNQAGCFMQVDEDGDATFLNIVNVPNGFSSLKSLLYNNGNFWASGTVSNTGFAYGNIIKFNAQGDTIWVKVYDEYEMSSFSHIVTSPDQSGYYACGNANMDFSGNPDQSDILLIKIDENGNVLWDTIYNPSGNDQVVEMAITADNHLLVAGQRTVSPSTQARLGLLYKLDLSGNVAWENNLYRALYGAVKVLSDGNYGTCGSIYRSNGISNYQLDALLVKINAETGQTMWHRSFGSISHQDYAYDFTPTPDGGFMVVGRMDSTNYAYAYALKLNCMGLLTEPQAAFAYQTTAGSNLVELVNQSQYVYPDSIDGGHYVWDFGDGSPPFRCGQGYGACPGVVTHEYAAAQGQHTITLRAVVCSDTSAVTASVALGSGIGGQSVGVEEVEAIEEAANPTPTLLHFVPNPATDRLFVPYRLDEGKEALLQIYDINGKSVLRTTLQGSGTQELSTESLAPGIYVLQAILNGTAIAQQKIVIVK